MHILFWSLINNILFIKYSIFNIFSNSFHLQFFNCCFVQFCKIMSIGWYINWRSLQKISQSCQKIFYSMCFTIYYSIYFIPIYLKIYFFKHFSIKQFPIYYFLISLACIYIIMNLHQFWIKLMQNFCNAFSIWKISCNISLDLWKTKLINPTINISKKICLLLFFLIHYFIINKLIIFHLII